MKKSAMTVLSAFVFVLVVIGCNGGGNDSNTSSNATNNDSISKVLGISGGTLTTPSGNTTLNVPAGALASNVTITVSQNNQSNLPGNMAVVYDFEPSGLAFNSAVDVSFKYDPALIPTGVNESDLVVAYQVSDNNWVEIPTTTDLVNHVLDGQTTHFTTYKPKPKAAKWGDLLGNLNGVDVRSNYNTNYNNNPNNLPYKYNCCTVTLTGLSCFPTSGICSGIKTGMAWECTEFVHRYYLQIYGIDLSWAGNANGYYDYYALASHNSLVAYPNNGTSLPQPGDIVVSNGDGSPGNVGHVAIVKGLTPTTVAIVQQNWNENALDVNASFIPRNGNVLGKFGGGTQYPVVGWLRYSPNGIPTVTSISPNSVGSGGSNFTLTVNGTNFVLTSVVNINGSPRTTTFVSSNQLTATITASDIASPRTSAITVFNPAPGGGTSNSVNLVVSNPTPVVGVIASGLNDSIGIAVDSVSVYWTEYGGGTVKKVGLNGGTITTLASGLINPSAIAVDAVGVYWLESGSAGTVKKTGLNGGAIITLASGLSYPITIAIDSTGIYWTEYTGGTVKMMGLNGGVVTTLASGLYPFGPCAITFDSNGVYLVGWWSGGTLYKVALNGGAKTTLASGLSSLDAIAIDFTSVYWVSYFNNGTVRKVGLNGGAITSVGSGLSHPTAIAIDSNYVYWVSGGSSGVLTKIAK